jgi:hypothetical protein
MVRPLTNAKEKKDMSTRVVVIMLLTFTLSIIVLSQETKTLRIKDPAVKSPNEDRENLKDLDTASRKKFLFEKVAKVYGEGEYEIEDMKSNIAPGDVASGVEVAKTTEEVTIDTTPCAKKKTLITFHKEYKKEDVSDVTCDGKKFKRVQVEQK